MNPETMTAFYDELSKIATEKDSGFMDSMGEMAAKAKGALTTPIAGTPSLNPFHAASVMAQGAKTPGQASRGFQQFQQMRSAAGH
jgi:hypothetical protein